MLDLVKLYEAKCLELLEKIENGTEVDVEVERNKIENCEINEIKISTAMDNLYIKREQFDFLTDEEFTDLKKCKPSNYLEYLNTLDKGFFYLIEKNHYYGFEYKVTIGLVVEPK